MAIMRDEPPNTQVVILSAERAGEWREGQRGRRADTVDDQSGAGLSRPAFCLIFASFEWATMNRKPSLLSYPDLIHVR
jgi:hypothetical protein